MGILEARLGPERPSAESVAAEVDKVKKHFLSVCQPICIYLFGSAYTGGFTYISDLDFALIFRTLDEIKVAKSRLYGKGLFSEYPCDLLFFTLDHFERKSQIGGVCMEIALNGKVIYDQRSSL